jgi:hypothetical protein
MNAYSLVVLLVARTLAPAAPSSLDAITSVYSDLPTVPAGVEFVLASAAPTLGITNTDSDASCQLGRVAYREM